MKKAGMLFLFCIFFLTAGYTWAETLTLHADKDTYLDKLSPVTNFGQKWSILTSGSPVSKLANGLLHFDFNDLPADAVVKDAKLTFLLHSNHSTTNYFVHPLSAFWQGDAATWNLAETGLPWTTAGGDYDPASFLEIPLPSSTPQWVVTDVTALVCDQQGNIKSAVSDNGLIVRADAGYNKILSSEFSTYANARTCHSCHGANDTSLDVGKSTNCMQCHVRDGIRVSGDPALIVNYEPMLFQFVQVSDVHVGRSPQQLTNLVNAVSQINGINPAFVLFTGDLTNSGAIVDYTAFKDAVSLFAMPYYCVPGDNDIVDGEGTLQRYHDQMGSDYYAFDNLGFNFIGLNNNSELSLDQIQRQWLDDELKEGKPEIVFAHKPLLNDMQSFAPFAGAEQLLTLLDTSNALMYMNGHAHVAASYTYNDTHFIWCDNLSYAHMGDTYNLYKVYADRILLYRFDLRNGSQTFAGNFPLAESPTLITLAFFEAVPSHNKVTVKWATAGEIDNAGFNIYRAESGGQYMQINNDIIPAQGSPTSGAGYEFVDDGLINRTVYSYKLEDIDTSGKATLHGPVTATPRLIYFFQ